MLEYERPQGGDIIRSNNAREPNAQQQAQCKSFHCTAVDPHTKCNRMCVDLLAQ